MANLETACLFNEGRVVKHILRFDFRWNKARVFYPRMDHVRIQRTTVEHRCIRQGLR
jgi:hypothetical protein